MKFKNSKTKVLMSKVPAITQCLILAGLFLLMPLKALIAQDVLTLVSPDNDILTGTIILRANQTVNASNLVASGANATYEAGQTINLIPGFEAEEGSDFTARIGLSSPDASTSGLRTASGDRDVNYYDKLAVYPNPNTGQFQLDIDLDEKDLASPALWQVEIHQPGGGILYSKELPSAAKFDVNISYAPKGQYLVLLREGASLRVSKVMIVQ